MVSQTKSQFGTGTPLALPQTEGLAKSKNVTPDL